jgi:hypothetical protein
MVVLVVVGVMNIAVMAALSVVIAIEKLWRRGPGFARVVGIVLISFAVLSLFFPALLPGLHRGPASPAMSGPGSMQMEKS